MTAHEFGMIMCDVLGGLASMDPSFGEEECRLIGDWNPKHYDWQPYDLTAKKIIQRSDSKPKRRGRTRMRGSISCQVENCRNDLTRLKEYHQRYKICEFHMKANSIDREGTLQRFCQQCGRFHGLGEFDGPKRSCRVRLERHNLRRRKKEREPIKRAGSTHGSSLWSNSPTASKIDVDLESLTDHEADPAAVASSLFTPQELCYTGLFSMTMLRLRVCLGFSKNGYRHGPFVNDTTGFTNNQVATSETSCLENWSLVFIETEYDPNIVPCSLTGPYRPFLTPDDPPSFLQGVHHQISDFSVATGMRMPTDAGVSLTMPFINRLFSGNRLMDPITVIPPRTSVSTSFGDPSVQTPLPLCCNTPTDVQVASMRSGDAESLVMEGMIRDDRQDIDRAAAYKSLLKLTSFSVKIFNCVPGNLPPGLRNELLHAVRGGIVPEGYMRPGCVHLTFDVWQPAYRAATPLEDIVDALLASSCSFWKDFEWMIQARGEFMRIGLKGERQQGRMKAEQDLYSNIQSIYPSCVRTSATAQRFTVKGSNIDAQNSSIHCRTRGSYVPVSLVKFESGSVSFTVDQSLPCGTMHVEIATNGMINHILPVLCLSDDAVFDEIQRFHHQQGSTDIEFMEELGLVCELHSWLNGQCRRFCVDTVDLSALLCAQKDRPSFRKASMAEMHCCFLTACQLFVYCQRQGLTRTADFLQPLVGMLVDNRIDGQLYINGDRTEENKERLKKFMKLVVQHHANTVVTAPTR